MLTGPTNLTPAPEDASEGDVAAHKIADCRLREPQAGLWLSIIHRDLAFSIVTLSRAAPTHAV